MKKNSYTVLLDGRPVVGPEGRLHGYSTLSGAKKAMREIASRWRKFAPTKRFVVDSDIINTITLCTPRTEKILTIGVDIEELSPEPK